MNGTDYKRVLERKTKSWVFEVLVSGGKGKKRRLDNRPALLSLFMYTTQAYSLDHWCTSPENPDSCAYKQPASLIRYIRIAAPVPCDRSARAFQPTVTHSFLASDAGSRRIQSASGALGQ